MKVRVGYKFRKSWYRGDMVYQNGKSFLTVVLPDANTGMSVAKIAELAKKEASKILQARIRHDKKNLFPEGALEFAEVQSVTIHI